MRTGLRRTKEHVANIIYYVEVSVSTCLRVVLTWARWFLRVLMLDEHDACSTSEKRLHARALRRRRAHVNVMYENGERGILEGVERSKM